MCSLKNLKLFFVKSKIPPNLPLQREELFTSVQKKLKSIFLSFIQKRREIPSLEKGGLGRICF